MKRKICVFTGTRAEYGQMRWLMENIRNSPDMQLQVIVTGAHLSPEYGLTFREVEADGFTIDAKVEMLLSSDTSTAVVKSMGLGLIGIADVFERLRPDILVLLGDRYELLAAAAAALVQRIPIAHLHGGEITLGALDDAIRHAITKMSHLHFVAAEEYRRRVVQLGEHPDRVFLVGGLGVDVVKRTRLMKRHELEESLNFTLGRKNLLVTFHPMTLEDSTAGDQVAELLAALDGLEDTQLIMTLPNADAGGREIAQQINCFVALHPNARIYSSLGQRRYLSCMKYVDGVVGNSSSGLAEAPSFAIGTVNIGDRQKGRLRAESIIDCAPQRDAIGAAIAELYSPAFREILARGVHNPYGDGGASERIVQVLHDHSLADIRKKPFYDVSY